VRFDGLDDKLIIAEGIETALSVYLSTGYTTYAALSASIIENTILPPSDQVPKIFSHAFPIAITKHRNIFEVSVF